MRLTIFETCQEAVDQAKGLAAFHDTPWVVWRVGDRFTACPEADNPLRLLPKPADTLRPVAVYDPDGTEHS